MRDYRYLNDLAANIIEKFPPDLEEFTPEEQRQIRRVLRSLEELARLFKSNQRLDR